MESIYRVEGCSACSRPSDCKLRTQLKFMYKYICGVNCPNLGGSFNRCSCLLLLNSVSFIGTYGGVFFFVCLLLLERHSNGEIINLVMII